MKKTKIIVLTLMMVLIGSIVFTACGGSDNGGTTPPPDNGGTTPPDNGGTTPPPDEQGDILVVPGMESNVKLNVGDVIPDLKFKIHPVSAGEESSIYQYMEETGAKALVLDFWAVWCEPCKEELPYLEKLLRDYKDMGLVVLGATIDPYDYEFKINETLEGDGKIMKSWKKLGEFPKDEQGNIITYPVPVDGDREMSKSLGVTSIPRTFLITADHKLYYQHTGFDEGKVNDLTEKVKEVLEQ